MRVKAFRNMYNRILWIPGNNLDPKCITVGLLKYKIFPSADLAS